MNMHVSLDTRATALPDEMKAPAAGSFLDEQGMPSHRSGPDLTLAEPIESVLRRLGRVRNAYPMEFLRAARASGIHVSVTMERDGYEHLNLMLPCDTQMELREPRYRALVDHLHARSKRRERVIAMLNLTGRFLDQRAFRSVAEAAHRYVLGGGRIYVLASGVCEEVLPYDERMILAESWDGFPVRRMIQRYEVTLRSATARETLARLIRARGVRHASSGAYVLELTGRRDIDRQAAQWRREWLQAGGRVGCGSSGLLVIDEPATASSRAALFSILARPGLKQALARLVAHPSIAAPAAEVMEK